LPRMGSAHTPEQSQALVGHDRLEQDRQPPHRKLGHVAREPRARTAGPLPRPADPPPARTSARTPPTPSARESTGRPAHDQLWIGTPSVVMASGARGVHRRLDVFVARRRSRTASRAQFSAGANSVTGVGDDRPISSTRSDTRGRSPRPPVPRGPRRPGPRDPPSVHAEKAAGRERSAGSAGSPRRRRRVNAGGDGNSSGGSRRQAAFRVTGPYGRRLGRSKAAQ